VAKGAERDGGVADVSAVGEHHLQHSDVTDDRRRDGGDEKENRSCEEKEGAEMMKDSCFRHCADCVLICLGSICW
jgi:hypothetical protein